MLNAETFGVLALTDLVDDLFTQPEVGAPREYDTSREGEGRGAHGEQNSPCKELVHARAFEPLRHVFEFQDASGIRQCLGSRGQIAARSRWVGREVERSP